jgi:hypothetical protein
LIVAGGVYLEVCVSPESISLFGSGGRAAMGLANLSPKVQLHSFQPAAMADDIFANFEPFGIDVHLYPTSDRIAFKYLFPLGRPRITPVPLPQAGTVAVSGDVVLRFGCLEGDFKVDADRAVFDPQSGVRPEAFSANGSRARRLAVVLNRFELRAATGAGTVEDGVAALMTHHGAEVVVVKRGPDGARVFARDAPLVTVPAFQTQAIYKVGSGDIFSAAFAHYWAEVGLAPGEAARLASLHTADYVENRLLPLRSPPSERPEVRVAPQRTMTVAFVIAGASGSWLRDEVVVALADLSIIPRVVEVRAPHEWPPDGTTPDTLLVIAQTPEPALTSLLQAARSAQIPTFAYVENLSPTTSAEWERLGVGIEQDLTSALYRAAWS